jgi:tetratricopeptide (TPR) repeat protein
MKFSCDYILLLISLSLPFVNVNAEEGCVNEAGKITSIEGEVIIKSVTNGERQPASLGHHLCEEDTIQVGEHSRAAIQLNNHAVLRLDQNTTLRLVNVNNNAEEWALIDLSGGAIHAFSRAPFRVKVNLPFLKGLIKGTEYYARAEPEFSEMTVLEGQVEVQNSYGRAIVEPGFKAIGKNGAAPVLQMLVKPRDAVQWALYYPPIFAGVDGQSKLGQAESVTLSNAFQLASQGNTSAALKILEQTPEARRDAGFFFYRATMLLAVGRVNEAKADLEAMLRQDPKQALAYSLLAIIGVTQNQNEQALVDAEKAISLHDAAESRIALSYALQANYKLKAALERMQEAARKFNGNPLVWARLGELQLMSGETSAAISSAYRATALSPGSEKAQIVLGYAALAQFRNTEAGIAFNKAITLASSDPMAHLGLGLAKISNGELEAGRREIETAVALDSNNPLLRSYLGKAYFTEKRAKLDATQYGIAKSLDPHDPTAYLYDGIRKQSENRPVEALHDLQKSKDLNDNRAVYRSRLLLDKDRASRSVSLARVYKDLGFPTLGQREASLSLEADPANASAHRYLSDSYQGTRRREISRVSELLQAQLLQDVNVNPIQPSLAETNLNIFTLGGPTSPGFNEFTPLYERNTAKLDVNTFGGSNNTFGGEGAVTGLYNRFSFGAAGLHYQSDGWRKNNGLNQHIYDFFAQAAVTPELNVQAEYRRRESQEGDLAFNFDPGEFFTDKSKHRSQDMFRFGLRYSPDSKSNLIFSYIHTDLKQSGPDGSQQIDPTTIASNYVSGQQQSDQFEGQYIFEEENMNLVAGFAHSHAEQADNVELTFDDSAAPPPRTISIPNANDITATRGYLYSRIKIPRSFIWTLGFSYDDYVERQYSKTSFNPKFGVQWNPLQNVRLRAAWLRALKPALVNNRTIEPTQVGGFNQLFDDINGTLSTRYGAGIDWQITPNLSAGGEISWRQIEEPLTLDTSTSIKHQDEDFHSVYLYWTPVDRLALRAEFSYDYYRSQKGGDTDSGSFPPVAVETFSAPLSASYFDPSGWFARLGGTFVHQNLKADTLAFREQGNDSFFLVDVDIGYRLPKRYGIVSFGVKNLIDTQFNYQDDSFREFKDEPASTGPYFPERILMGRLLLNF